MIYLLTIKLDKMLIFLLKNFVFLIFLVSLHWIKILGL